MLSRIAAAVLAVTMLATACGDDGATAGADSVVGLDYATFDGGSASFDDRIGTPMVVNFFAEWCVNCITEMPEFEAVSQDLAGRVDFIGISIDRGSAEALALVDATGVTYDVGWDPSEELYAHFEGLSMPTTAFVDETGRITRVWSGVLDAESLREKIEEEIL
jgi:thiol-disulfide isomerase/thioredoxin